MTGSQTDDKPLYWRILLHGGQKDKWPRLCLGIDWIRCLEIDWIRCLENICITEAQYDLNNHLVIHNT